MEKKGGNKAFTLAYLASDTLPQKVKLICLCHGVVHISAY
jgi:hypothetical protein